MACPTVVSVGDWSEGGGEGAPWDVVFEDCTSRRGRLFDSDDIEAEDWRRLRDAVEPGASG